MGFRGSENTSKTMFFTQIPLLVRLIEVFVVEKSIGDKHGDAMARHRDRMASPDILPALRAPALQSDV